MLCSIGHRQLAIQKRQQLYVSSCKFCLDFIQAMLCRLSYISVCFDIFVRMNNRLLFSSASESGQSSRLRPTPTPVSALTRQPCSRLSSLPCQLSSPTGQLSGWDGFISRHQPSAAVNSRTAESFISRRRLVTSGRSTWQALSCVSKWIGENIRK